MLVDVVDVLALTQPALIDADVRQLPELVLLQLKGKPYKGLLSVGFENNRSFLIATYHKPGVLLLGRAGKVRDDPI
jgi:hypothetical protein